MTCWLRAASAMSTSSVISRISASAGTPNASSSISTCSGRATSCRLETDRFTATDRSWPGARQLLQVAQRPLQHAQGQAAHEPGLLGERQEDVGVEQAAARVVPAHQRLHADDARRCAGRAWAGSGRRAGRSSSAVAQLLEGLQPVARGRGAVGRPDLEAVPAALGHVHRGVGAGQQQRAVAAVLGAQRDADAGVDVQRHAVELERVAQRGAESARRPRGRGRRRRRAGGRRTRRRPCGPAGRRAAGPAAAAGRPGRAGRRRRCARSCR